MEKNKQSKRITVSEVLRIIGEESRAKGADKLTSRQIDKIIQATPRRKIKAALIRSPRLLRRPLSDV